MALQTAFWWRVLLTAATLMGCVNSMSFHVSFQIALCWTFFSQWLHWKGLSPEGTLIWATRLHFFENFFSQLIRWWGSFSVCTRRCLFNADSDMNIISQRDVHVIWVQYEISYVYPDCSFVQKSSHSCYIDKVSPMYVFVEECSMQIHMYVFSYRCDIHVVYFPCWLRLCSICGSN